MKNIKAHISLILSLIIAFFSINCFSLAEDDTKRIEDAALKTAKIICENISEPAFSQIGGEWAVFGVNMSKCEGYEAFKEKYIKNISSYLAECKGVLSDRKYTEYSRVVTALTSLGIDAQNVCGFNLVMPLSDYEKVSFQRVNGPAWALIALDSGNYEDNENGGLLRKKYIDNLLNAQNADGGWAIGGFEVSDADVTAMVITSLSKYVLNNDVKKSIDRAVLFLSKMQSNNGGFESFGDFNSESTSQVITALSSIGISYSDERFVKNGKTLVDNLFSYYDENGGFYHAGGEKSINQMATEQALCALLSIVKRTGKGKSLYDFSDEDKNAFNGNENTDFGLSGKHKDVLKRSVICDKTFDDILNHSAKSEIEALAKRGIINGKSENLFEPDMTMTRAEFATIVTNALGLKKEGADVFSDVNKNDWFYDFVCTAYMYNIVSGTGNNAFNPNGVITKEEAAVMIRRAASLCGINGNYGENEIRDVLSAFADYKDINGWAEESLAFCYDKKILLDDDILINPKSFVTRSEIAKMLYNLLEKSKLL